MLDALSGRRRSSKLKRCFEEARSVLRQGGSSRDVEQDVQWQMNLQETASRLLDSVDPLEWGKKKANLEVGAELAKALGKIQLADQLARLVAAGVSLNAEPESPQEIEMTELFRRLSDPPLDPYCQTLIARDCLGALALVCAYHNRRKKKPYLTKMLSVGNRGYRLREVALQRLFEGALFSDAENLVESFAIVAECSPLSSPERLAAVVGLLRYPQYTRGIDDSGPESYIETFAPIGSQVRNEAVEILNADATFPLRELLVRAAEKKQE